jgi:hypothetical protein
MSCWCGHGPWWHHYMPAHPPPGYYSPSPAGAAPARCPTAGTTSNSDAAPRASPSATNTPATNGTPPGRWLWRRHEASTPAAWTAALSPITARSRCCPTSSCAAPSWPPASWRPTPRSATSVETSWSAGRDKRRPEEQLAAIRRSWKNCAGPARLATEAHWGVRLVAVRRLPSGQVVPAIFTGLSRPGARVMAPLG